MVKIVTQRRMSKNMSTLPGKKMKALVLYGPNDYKIEDVDVPEPGYQEVLCRVRSIAICGTDPHLIAGEYPGFWPPGYPFIPGHEWAGEVVEVGRGVVNFKVGDRVSAESAKGCGFCPRCLEGRYNICANYGKRETGHKHYGFTESGGYAEYCAISIKSIHKLSSSISFDEGALVDTAGVGLHAVNRGRIQPGDVVTIIGPGAIGLMTQQFAQAAGAGKIIMIGYGEVSKPGLELSKKMGADLTIDSSVEDPAKIVKGETDGLGADVVIECSGSKGGYRTLLNVVRQGGKLICIGLMAGAEVPIPMDRIALNELEVYGVRANPNSCDDVIRLLEKGKVNFRPLITHTFPLTEFPRALEVFTKRIEGAIKVIIHP
ncbi:MAG: alcohol dehydrogenase catalytic domain-containing protein [Candidatus Bathyarchaeia archaeon]